MPEQSLVVRKMLYVGMNAVSRPKKALTRRAESRALRLPTVSPRAPHTTAPTIIPRKVMAAGQHTHTWDRYQVTSEHYMLYSVTVISLLF